MKRLNYKEKGITLIALVITIIILLILAGVTLNGALSANGLFARAKYAGEKYKESEADEAEKLGEAEKEIDKIIDGKNSGDEEEIQEYGNVMIVTKTENYNTVYEDGTDVAIYQVTGKINGEIVYSNIFTAFLEADPAASSEINLKDIPLNAEVTITQKYINPLYELKSNNEQTCIAKKEDSDENKVEFEIEAKDEQYKVLGCVKTSELLYDNELDKWNLHDINMAVVEPKIPVGDGGFFLFPSSPDISDKLDSNVITFTVTVDVEGQPCSARAKILTPEGINWDTIGTGQWSLNNDGYWHNITMSDIDGTDALSINADFESVKKDKRFDKNINIAFVIEYTYKQYDEEGELIDPFIQ